MFDNYRCRICGQYISVERKSGSSRKYDFEPGMLFTKEYHLNCTLLEDGEHAYCDHTSFSEGPLKRSVEVIKLKEGKYELAENT